MTISVLGDKFQLVIPKQVREVLGLKARDKLVVWTEGERIEAMPLKKYKDPLDVLAKLSQRKYKLSVEQIEREAEQRH